MKITVSRFVSDKDATLSHVHVDDKFVCFGLEDEFRADKVPGETRIPAGCYAIKLKTFGGFHGRYARKFPFLHRGMLQVCDVPDFTDILIHIGNTDDDTAGCLLVGLGCTTAGGISISSSSMAYQKLYQIVVDAAIAGDLTIEYIDFD